MFIQLHSIVAGRTLLEVLASVTRFHFPRDFQLLISLSLSFGDQCDAVISLRASTRWS